MQGHISYNNQLYIDEIDNLPAHASYRSKP